MSILKQGVLIRALVLFLGPLFAFGATETDLLKDTVLSWLLPANYSTDQGDSCYKDLSELVWGFFRQEEWALKMLNAAGKPDAAVLERNVFGLVGNYKECLGIKKEEIEGQHCWIDLANGNKLMGICLPNSCKNKHFQPITNLVKAVYIDCEYRNIEMTMTSFVAIVIYSILLFFVLLGTFVDVKRSTTRKNADGNKEKSHFKNCCAGFTRFLLRLSLYSNCKRLFRLTNDRGNVTFGQLDALKVMVMAQVIFTHSHTFLPDVRTKEPMAVTMDEGHWLMRLLSPISAVGAFFLVTGFLTLYGILRNPLKDQDSKYRFVFSYILNRYIRLSLVPLTIVLVTRHAFTSYLSSGPYWIPIDSNCNHRWWKKALLVSNFWSMSDGCFAPWWFLSASVQLHLLSLCIIIPLINRKYRMGVVSGSVMVVASWCWVCWKSYQLDAPPLFMQRISIEERNKFFSTRNPFYDNIHQATQNYIGPYLVGMALAWVLFQRKDGITLTKKRVCLGWTFSSILYFLTLYGVYLRPNRMWKSVHTALAPTTYGLFIAWVILVCHTKNRGLVSSVLRWKYWSPLSKLGLSAYLVHTTVIESVYNSEVGQIKYSLPLLFIYFLRHWAITFPLAILTTLTIEMPLSAILDLVLRG